MSVRAKMLCESTVAGQIGQSVTLRAVYEGSAELQKLSENSVFGDATPSGYAQLTGRGLEMFEGQEEYYLDFTDGLSDVPHVDPDRFAPLVLRVQKVFRSETNPNHPADQQTINFRFVGWCTGDVDVSVGMSIANPAAIEWLDRFTGLNITVRRALGRRSQREIDIRQKALDDHLATDPASWHHNPQAWPHHKAMLERKLARAKGNLPDTLTDG